VKTRGSSGYGPSNGGCSALLSNSEGSCAQNHGENTRGISRSVLERGYDSFNKPLAEDTYPALEGIKNISYSGDDRSQGGDGRPEDFVDFCFLDELKKSGYLDKLYGRS